MIKDYGHYHAICDMLTYVTCDTGSAGFARAIWFPQGWQKYKRTSVFSGHRTLMVASISRFLFFLQGPFVCSLLLPQSEEKMTMATLGKGLLSPAGQVLAVCTASVRLPKRNRNTKKGMRGREALRTALKIRPAAMLFFTKGTRVVAILKKEEKEPPCTLVS